MLFFTLFLLFFSLINNTTESAKLRKSSTSSSTTEKSSNTTVNCNPKTIDDCFSPIFFVSKPNSVWPTTNDVLGKLCKKFKKHQQCIKDYADQCLDKASKNTISVMIYSITKGNKLYCQSNKRREAYFKLGHCINRDMPGLAKNWIDFTKAIHSIQEYPDNKSRIPMICCHYWKVKVDSMNHVEKLCPDLLDEYERFIDSFDSDTTNILCSDYTSDSDKCDPIITKTPKWTKPLKYQTFLVPMAQTLNSL